MPDHSGVEVPDPSSPDIIRRDHATDLEAQRSPTGQISPVAERHVQSPAINPLDHVRSTKSFDSIRRPKRTLTAKTYRPKIKGRQWNPGQEPGIDPTGKHPASAPVGLKADCDITVVDFSQESMQVQYHDNYSLKSFLQSTEEEEPTCRWINVNGLSWDVISALGTKYKFHKLAVEDLINTKNRTKADFYTDHTYIVLPLQKLVHMHLDESDSSDSDNDDNDDTDRFSFASTKPKKKKRKGVFRAISKAIKRMSSKKGPPPPPHHHIDPSVYGDAANGVNGDMNTHAITPPTTPDNVRTLQAYHGGPNVERTEYMERQSVLRPKGLAVTVEQVSIFLMDNNTVVSFFEHSAEDIETPILNRLSSAETVIRRCSEASMVVQAIIDAIVDLAIPVTVAYKDAIEELELNVLTEPSIKDTRLLYITTSEISQFRFTIWPIVNLVSALRDHKSEPIRLTGTETPRPGTEQFHFISTKKPTPAGVTISSWTYIYLKDVEDHIVLMASNLDSMMRASDNMIDLIFNTISAYQNESMKQLTLVTILFLPLTFVAGYFGMNFPNFDGVNNNSDLFFWVISLPVTGVIFLWLLRDSIARWFVKTVQRRGINKRRKERISLLRKRK